MEKMVVIEKIRYISFAMCLKIHKFTFLDTLNPLKHICTTTNRTTIGAFTLYKQEQYGKIYKSKLEAEKFHTNVKKIIVIKIKNITENVIKIQIHQSV